jgi:hypothetical protein
MTNVNVLPVSNKQKDGDGAEGVTGTGTVQPSPYV